MAKYSNMKCEVVEVEDRRSAKFNAFYISHAARSPQPCIIYLHGLSSFCFEGQYLLGHLGDFYSLCLYDLRGHGKNKREMVSFGI